MRVVRLGAGSWGEVRAVVASGGQVPVLEFLMGLDSNQGKAVRKMMRLLSEHVPTQGPPRHNIQVSRNLGGSIFELKVGQVRVLYFYDHDERAAVVCTHGFLKKTRKTPPGEIKRAGKEREQYLRSKQDGRLTIESMKKREGWS